MCNNFECEHKHKCINEPICETHKCPFIWALTQTLDICHFCTSRKVCPQYKVDKRDKNNKQA